MPKALVIRAAGTNCDAEMVRAFALAGAATDLVHIDRLILEPQRLLDADLLGFPGGFSFGDDIASGRIFALLIRERLYPALKSAAERGCLIIGACNGFQVLVQTGLLPGPAAHSPGAAPRWPDQPPPQETSLTFNRSARFIDRWVRVQPAAQSVCLWTANLADAWSDHERHTLLRLPIAHGEGRFVAPQPVLARLAAAGQVPLRYAHDDNPNGSADDIAGICDPSGRIFGLMPHPERFLDWNRHPFWTRIDSSIRARLTPGRLIFENAVAAARGHLRHSTPAQPAPAQPAPSHAPSTRSRPAATA